MINFEVQSAWLAKSFVKEQKNQFEVSILADDETSLEKICKSLEISVTEDLNDSLEALKDNEPVNNNDESLDFIEVDKGALGIDIKLLKTADNEDLKNIKFNFKIPLDTQVLVSLPQLVGDAISEPASSFVKQWMRSKVLTNRPVGDGIHVRTTKERCVCTIFNDGVGKIDAWIGNGHKDGTRPHSVKDLKGGNHETLYKVSRSGEIEFILHIFKSPGSSGNPLVRVEGTITVS